MVSRLTHSETQRKTLQIIANRIQTGSLKDSREGKAKESKRSIQIHNPVCGVTVIGSTKVLDTYIEEVFYFYLKVFFVNGITSKVVNK